VSTWTKQAELQSDTQSAAVTPRSNEQSQESMIGLSHETED